MSDPISADVAEPEREVDPSDPYAREAQTFPRLSVDAANRVANYGVEQGLRKARGCSSVASAALTSFSCSKATSKSSMWTAKASRMY